MSDPPLSWHLRTMPQTPTFEAFKPKQMPKEQSLPHPVPSQIAWHKDFRLCLIAIHLAGENQSLEFVISGGKGNESFLPWKGREKAENVMISHVNATVQYCQEAQFFLGSAKSGESPSLSMLHSGGMKVFHPYFRP